MTELADRVLLPGRFRGDLAALSAIGVKRVSVGSALKPFIFKKYFGDERLIQETDARWSAAPPLSTGLLDASIW